MQKREEISSSNFKTYKVPKKGKKKKPEMDKPNWIDFFLKPQYVTKYFWWKQKEYTKNSTKHPLDYSDIIAITIFSLISAFITIFTKVLTWARWSTFPDSTYFATYHPLVPWIAIFGSILYLIALYMKRVNFWLAYFPAILLIIYYIIQASLICGWITPQDLLEFFRSVGLDPFNFPDWLTGGTF
jgi:hypothetical protein